MFWTRKKTNVSPAVERLIQAPCPVCNRHTLQDQKYDNSRYCYICGSFLIYEAGWKALGKDTIHKI